MSDVLRDGSLLSTRRMSLSVGLLHVLETYLLSRRGEDVAARAIYDAFQAEAAEHIREVLEETK